MTGKGNHRIARKTRPCPLCPCPIRKGERIARTGWSKSSDMAWGHEQCVHRDNQQARRRLASMQRRFGGLLEDLAVR